MGVKNINKIIGTYARYVSLKNYENQRIGIDARNWMYRFLRSPAYSHHKYPILKGFLNQINTFARYNITPIYVFDGKGGEEKLDTLQKRKDQRALVTSRIEALNEEINKRASELKNEDEEEIEEDIDIDVMISTDGTIDLSLLTEEANNTEAVDVEEGDDNLKGMTLEEMQKKVKSLMVQTFVPTYKDADMCKQLFKLTNIKYISAYGEADEVLGVLDRRNAIDAVLSADMDLLAYGTTNLLADLKTAKGGGAVCKEYKLEGILKDMGWCHAQFVDFCILCGCDYIDRIPWLGCKTAKKYIDTHKTIENVVADIEKKKKGRIRMEPDEIKEYMIKVTKARNIFNLINLDKTDEDVNEHNNLINEHKRKLNVENQEEINIDEKDEENEEKSEDEEIHKRPKRLNSWMPDKVDKYSDDEKIEFFIIHELPNYIPYAAPSTTQPGKKAKTKKGKKTVDNNQSSITKFFN
jgi:5'-3' exonuclease